MTGPLAGRVVVVTGAATGIGRATALRFSAAGATVAVADIDPDGGRKCAAACANGALFVLTDVADVGALGALAETVRRELGPADVLVNNAGVVRWQSIEALTEATWETLSAINLRSTLFAVQAFLPQLATSGRGSVVNIASTSALVGAPDMAAYSATKGGVVAASRALAVELAPRGIRVNAVCPGAVDTAIMDQALARTPGGTREDFAASIPIGRNGDADDIAAMVAWLASDDAGFVTGAEFVVDGGTTAAQSLNPRSRSAPSARSGASSGA